MSFFSQHLFLHYSHQTLCKSLYCWSKFIFYMCLDTLYSLLY
jgi:hypothetical protein